MGGSWGGAEAAGGRPGSLRHRPWPSLNELTPACTAFCLEVNYCCEKAALSTVAIEKLGTSDVIPGTSQIWPCGSPGKAPPPTELLSSISVNLKQVIKRLLHFNVCSFIKQWFIVERYHYHYLCSSR